MRYLFTGTLNTRDLGGHPTASGVYTKYGRLIRGDAATQLTCADLDMLYDMGITTAIDLRHPDFEAARRPSSFASDDRFRYHNRHLDDRMRDVVKAESDIAPAYFDMARRGDTVRDVMKIIAAAEGGVVFHCSAGKDRTGVTAAMLLDLAGVPMVDIVADYQVTETYIRSRMERILEEFPDMPRFFGQSKPEYIEGFFELLWAEYGTTEDFLLARGVESDELERIRAKLLG